MKTKLQKTIVLCLLAILVLSLVYLYGCKKETEEKYQIKECYIPYDMPENTGTIEWLNDVGGNASFMGSKPTVILLEGMTPMNQGYGFKLPSTVYYFGEGGVLSEQSKSMKTDTAYYWFTQGYNVGVFHAECFTNDTKEAIESKSTNAKAMSYINKDETVSYSNEIDYSLAELLCSAWEKTISATPLTGSGLYGPVQELRLIANDCMAVTALEATKLLFKKYTEGNVSGSAVTTRITLTSPDFTSANINYCAEEIKSQAEKGVVFEIVSSEEDYGFAPSSSEEASLAEIFTNSAVLNFRETYSSSFDTQYAKLNRTALDWYLYSVNGSDGEEVHSINISNLGQNDTYPILDKIKGMDGSVPSMSTCRYALSAWTPTAYMRSLRGITFQMKHMYNSMLAAYEDYTLTKFSSECYQFSNYSGYQVSGYVYTTFGSSMFVNYGYNARLSGVRVEATIIDNNSNQTTTKRTTTGKDGFYTIRVSDTDAEISVYIEVTTPDSRYAQYATKISPSTYKAISMNNYVTNTTGLPKDGTSCSFTAPAKIGQNITVNCAMKIV